MLGVADTAAVPRRHLVRELRRLRKEQARMFRKEVTKRLSWPHTRIEHLEYGDTRPRPSDVAALCGLYGADEHTTACLVAIATHTQNSPFWQTRPTGDSHALGIYPQLRQHAERICEYQPIRVPTLLQTEAYASLQLAETATDSDERERQVAARLDEARLLTRAQPDPPQLSVVLDEVVLRQFPHRPDVMAEQLRHLVQLGELPHVDIRVVPFTAGPHPGLLMTSGFMVLDFPEPQGPTPIRPPGFTETGDPEMTTDTGQYRAAFHDLLTLALDTDATRHLLLNDAGDVCALAKPHDLLVSHTPRAPRSWKGETA